MAAAVMAPATPGAQAQSFFSLGGGRPTTPETVPVRMSGRIIVQFHGDTAAGCAIHGLCGYSGTVSWTAPQNADLTIESSRIGGRTHHTFALFPQASGPGAPSGGITSAEVTRTSLPGQSMGTTCADATPTQDAFVLAAPGGEVQFGLAQASPSLLATRCAGPRDAVILPLLPSPRFSVTTVRRGRLTVALTGSRSFAADGFAGTVVSDVVIRLGRPGRPTRVRSAPATGAPRSALRVRLRATLVGSVVEHVAADPDPGVCAPLGACGAIGTLTIRPRPTDAPAEVEAVGPAGRPGPGLNSVTRTGAGRAGRISVFGTAPWSPGGTVDATIAQGLDQCSDSAPWTGGLLTLGAVHGRLIAAYSGTGYLSGLPSPTGCPGPGGVSTSTALAEGTVPLSRLARRRVTIRLTTGTGFHDYGYRIRTTADLTLTLIRVSTQAIAIPPF